MCGSCVRCRPTLTALDLVVPLLLPLLLLLLPAGGVHATQPPRRIQARCLPPRHARPRADTCHREAAAAAKPTPPSFHRSLNHPSVASVLPNTPRRTVAASLVSWAINSRCVLQRPPDSPKQGHRMHGGASLPTKQKLAAHGRCSSITHAHAPVHGRAAARRALVNAQLWSRRGLCQHCQCAAQTTVRASSIARHWPGSSRCRQQTLTSTRHADDPRLMQT